MKIPILHIYFKTRQKSHYNKPYDKGKLMWLYIAISQGSNQWEAEWTKRRVYIEMHFGPTGINSTQFIL